jgi:hypothetical protein
MQRFQAWSTGAAWLQDACRTVFSVISVVLLIQCCGCERRSAWIRESDAQLGRLIALPSSVEARQWLEDETVAKEVRESVGPMVNRLYSAGAQRLVMADIRKSSGHPEAPRSMVVVLPDDKEARKRIFEIAANPSSVERMTTDLGQMYLYFPF